MKIAVLGATGRTGKLVLNRALELGYEVKCLARESGRITNRDGIGVIEGNCNSKRDLEQLVNGCDGIINVLNISRKTDFPWAGLKTPKNYLSEVMAHLIPIAENSRVKRIVICSAWGVGETKKDIPKWFRWLIDNSNIGMAYRDHERQEEILVKSKIDWTIVRPSGLTNSKKTEIIKESFDNKPKPSLTISRQSVAQYLCDSLDKDSLVQKKVVISKKS